MSKLVEHDAGSILDALLASMLLAHSNNDDNKPVLVFPAAITTVQVHDNAKISVYSMSSSIKYLSIISVLRRCKRKRTFISLEQGSSLHTNHVNGLGDVKRNGPAKFRNKYKPYWTPIINSGTKTKSSCRFVNKMFSQSMDNGHLIIMETNPYSLE